jgi:outer membrane protein OmpA-like peptidoglycan-associated protein
VSLAILLMVDLVIGPSAFAVPSAPAETSASVAPAAVPSGEPSGADPVEPPVESASASASASAPDPAVEVEAEAGLVGVGAPAKYAGGKTGGVVATFEFEQASADLAALQALAKHMHDDTVSEIVLEGHSDPSGNEYRNLTLSLDRANWCADRLVEYGINRMRIRTVGLGSARPIIDVGGDAGAINRRVEVRWVVRSADGGGG